MRGLIKESKLTMPCSEDLIWLNLVFWPAAALVVFLIARHNNFGIKDSFLAAIGAKKYKTTALIKLLLIVSLLGTLGLSVWIIQSCPN